MSHAQAFAQLSLTADVAHLNQFIRLTVHPYLALLSPLASMPISAVMRLCDLELLGFSAALQFNEFATLCSSICLQHICSRVQSCMSVLVLTLHICISCLPLFQYGLLELCAFCNTFVAILQSTPSHRHKYTYIRMYAHTCTYTCTDWCIMYGPNSYQSLRLKDKDLCFPTTIDRMKWTPWQTTAMK